MIVLASGYSTDTSQDLSYVKATQDEACPEVVKTGEQPIGNTMAPQKVASLTDTREKALGYKLTQSE